MDVRLVVVAPPKARKSYAVRLPLVVGRGDEAKFRVPLDSVSRQHCRFSVEDGVVCVTDLGSTNGTIVSGTRLEPHVARPVSSGSDVRIGSMVVRVEYAAAAVLAGTATGDSDTVPLPTTSTAPPAGEPAAELLPESEAVETAASAAPAATGGKAVEPAAAPAFPEVDPSPPPADASFDFLAATEPAPPPADADKLDDFFKSLS